jgi:outer membrane protein W
MKKVLVIAVLTACMFNLVSAQENYKPRGGDFSLEVGFVPFGQNIINEGGLTGFFHLSNNVALSLGLGLGFDSEVKNNGDTGDALLKNTESTFRFSLDPGIVYYFKGTPRLAPFIGAGISLGAQTKTIKDEVGTHEKKTKNCGYADAFIFGIGASTGFNYYFAKNLYVGAQVGLGLEFKSYLNQKIVETGQDHSDPKDKNHDTWIGIGAQPMLRLGWAF